MTKFYRNIDGSQALTTLPYIQIMCPAFIEHDFSTEEGLNSKEYCNVRGQEARLLTVEFIGSLIFILCWLILRNYKVHEGNIDPNF